MKNIFCQVCCLFLQVFRIPHCLLLLIVIPLILSAQTNRMTLAEVRTKVLLGNPSVAEQLERISAAQAVLKQARSAYYPTITLTGSYGIIDASMHPDFNPTARVSDSFRQASSGLQGNWLLFDGFARSARTLAAEYGVRQAREFTDETRRLLILAATLSFRQAQLAKENIRIAQQDNRFNKELERDARKRFDAGVIPESDVNNFSIRALQAEASMLAAELDFSTACTVLAELMALTEARLPERMQPVSIHNETIGTVALFDELLQYALINRPDYKALQSGELALVQRVKAVKGDRLPQIALVGEVNYAERDGYASSSRHGNYDSFVGVAASWDLFTGGRKINTVKEAQAELRALEKQKEALGLSIRSALRQRVDEAETVSKILQRYEKIQELSTSVRESVQKSYRAGVVSITRLNEAQTDLVRAKGNYLTSYISYLLVLNRLDIETGRVLE